MKNKPRTTPNKPTTTHRTFLDKNVLLFPHLLRETHNVISFNRSEFHKYSLEEMKECVMCSQPFGEEMPSSSSESDVCFACTAAGQVSNDIHTRDNVIRKGTSKSGTKEPSSPDCELNDQHSVASEASELCFEGDDVVKVNYPTIDDEHTDRRGEYDEESTIGTQCETNMSLSKSQSLKSEPPQVNRTFVGAEEMRVSVLTKATSQASSQALLEQKMSPSWNCSLCTMLNDCKRLRCSACENPRSATNDALNDSRVQAEQEKAWRSAASASKDVYSAHYHQKSNSTQKAASGGLALPYYPPVTSTSTVQRATVVWETTPTGSSYGILGCEYSQYSAGASSACTTMALIAVYKCLNTVPGRTRAPFGLTLDTLEEILQEGGEYQDDRHQNIEEAMNSRPDLTAAHVPTGLHLVKTMVDVSPTEPHHGLSLGFKFIDNIGGNVACVLTCQAQSVCIVYLPQINGCTAFVLFDSHSRTHARREYGACFLFFNGMEEICDYLRYLFRPVEQPDARYLTEYEVMQYEQMNMGQADFFCLNDDWNHRRDRIALPDSTPSSTPPAAPTAARLAQESVRAVDNTPKTIWMNTGKQHGASHTAAYHSPTGIPTAQSRSPLSPPSQAFGVSQSYGPVSSGDNLSHQLLLEINQLQHKIFDAQNALIEEKTSHSITKNELVAMRMALQSATSDMANMQSVEQRNLERIAQLEGEVAKLKHAQQQQKSWGWKSNKLKKATGGGQPPSTSSGQAKATGAANKKPAAAKPAAAAVSAPSAPPYLPRAWGVPDTYDMSTTSPSHDSGASSSGGSFSDDLELARRLQAEEEKINRDAVYAQRLASELADAEAEEMELLRRQEAQAEEDRRIAHALDRELYFTCVTCMDDRVFIEDLFDLGHRDHKLCRECGHGYISNAVNDRHIPVKCPFLNCEHELAEAKCLEVLDEEQQALWFSMSKRPHADPAFRQCPVPNCSGFDLVDTPEQCDVRCVVCEHHWCSSCQVDMDVSQHKDISCELYQQWKRENDTGDDAMEAFLRQGLQDQDGTDRMRRCPNCRVAYMKDQACMHVTCTGGCGVHFCFRCADFSADNAQAIYQHQGSCRGYSGGG